MLHLLSLPRFAACLVSKPLPLLLGLCCLGLFPDAVSLLLFRGVWLSGCVPLAAPVTVRVTWRGINHARKAISFLYSQRQ